MRSETGSLTGLLLWGALGDLVLLALAFLFPRHVFLVGPGTAWIPLSVAVIVWLATGRGLGLPFLEDLTRAVWMRYRAVTIPAVVAVALASTLVFWHFPAGVDVELVQPRGGRTAVGPRAELALDSRDVTALATRPETSARLRSNIVPGWNPPWVRNPVDVGAGLGIACPGKCILHVGSRTLRVSDGMALGADTVYLPGATGPVELEVTPGADPGGGSAEVTWEDRQLRWHLYRRPVSASWAWLIAVQRLALAAALVVLGPAFLALLFLRVRSWLSRSSRWAPRRELFLELGIVGSGVLLFCLALAPDVQISAGGHQGAYLAWADSLEHGQGAARPSVEKPLGLPLLLVLVRAMFGEEAGYFVPLGLAGLAVLLLYASARALHTSVALSVVGAASLAASSALCRSATLLNTDVAAMAWISSMLVTLLLCERGHRYSLLSGFSFGMACLCRLDAVVALAMAVPLLHGDRGRAGWFVAASAPFLLTILWARGLTSGLVQLPDAATAGAAPMGESPSALGSIRALASDLSPVVWIPSLAFPFLRAAPRVHRFALTGMILVSVALVASGVRADTHFTNPLLPVYPVIILGALSVCQRLAAGAGRVWSSRFRAAVAAVSLTWVSAAPSQAVTLPDSSRAAAAAVEYQVPPDAPLVASATLGTAVHYYSGRRRSPVTLRVPRAAEADLVTLKQAALASGGRSTGYVLLWDTEVASFRDAHPELELQEARAGYGWQLLGVAPAGSAPVTRSMKPLSSGTVLASTLALGCDSHIRPADYRRELPEEADWLLRATAPGEVTFDSPRETSGVVARLLVRGEPGRYGMEATFSGTLCEGPDGISPVIEVRSNGFPLVRWKLESEEATPLRASLMLDARPVRLEFAFVNDFAAAGCDRNVVLHGVKFTADAREAEPSGASRY